MPIALVLPADFTGINLGLLVGGGAYLVVALLLSAEVLGAAHVGRWVRAGYVQEGA